MSLESNSTSHAVRDASAPFDDAMADVILRSSDNVDFHVHKLLLTMASPFFTDLFSLPQPSAASLHADKSKGGLPVVPIAEDECAIDMMLRFCYPRSFCPVEPALETVEEMKVALQLANKYHLAVIQRASARRLRETRVFPHPERIFAMAWSFRMRDVVIAAARQTLRLPFVAETDSEEFDLVPASALVKLLDYRKRSVAVATQLATDLSWMDKATDYNPFAVVCKDYSCRGPSRMLRESIYVTFPGWWDGYFRSSSLALEIIPSDGTPLSPNLIASAIDAGMSCQECKCNRKIVATINHSSRRLSEEISRHLAEVSSPRI